MKRKIYVVALTLSMLFSLFLFLPGDNLTVRAESQFNGVYYGYGDSLMDGNHVTPPESDVFLIKMQQTYDATNDSYKNEDGGGLGSFWGYSNTASHVTNRSCKVIEMFGANDNKHEGLSCDMSATYKMGMYNLSVENSSEHLYYPCITVLGHSTNWESYEIQRMRLNAQQDMFKNYSVPFIPIYDSLDSDPWNGQDDDYADDGNYADEIHPNEAGNILMARMLWYFIDNQDYNETYHSGNDTIVVEADYNETIYIHPQSGWDLTKVEIICTTSDTTISDWYQGVNISGSTMIHLNITKGNTYTISENNTLYFISINSGVNQTIIQNNTPVFKWNRLDNVTVYRLEIANDSGFTDVVFNIDNICDIKYPSEYSHNDTIITFQLPSDSVLPSEKKYYCRIFSYWKD